MSNYTVKFSGKEVPASKYQEKIFKCIEKGSSNMIINASAGSSKTTTIINALNYIKPEKKVAFIAFNKDIVSKIKDIVHREHTHITTFHGLGYLILMENGINATVDDFKYKKFINEHINELSLINDKRKKTQYINNLRKLTEYSRYYLAFSEREIKKVSEIYGIIPVGDEFSSCKKVLEWGKENIQSIDYTDMIWLPNILNYTTKRYQYNWIFIDEAQDTSIAEQKLVEKCFKRGTRFCVVGDEYQQINIWCGSTEEAIDNFKNKPNTKVFDLPISYRCPKKIVELARNYSDNIIADDNAIDGIINHGVSEYEAKSGDMVLCRCTSPLIDLHLKYLERNKKSYVLGFENVKTNLFELINQTNSDFIDRSCNTKDGIFPQLYQNLFKKINSLQNTMKLEYDEALQHQSILRDYDNIMALNCIAKGISNRDELIDKINVIFNGDEKEGVMLSTIHKAKGLESDNVFILKPSLMPSSSAHKDWEIKSENNLIYVAYTRAKKSLNFIKENDNQFQRRTNGFNLGGMKREFEDIKAKIKYNEELNITSDNITITGSTNSNKLGVKKLTLPSQTSKKKGGMKFKQLMDE